MKLEYLEFSGYKAFPDSDPEGGSLQRLNLAPLTLLFGKNNSGKSIVARLPRLVLGGLACDDDRILPLEVRGLRYGGRFVDLIHGGDFFRRPTFKLHASHEAETLRISATLFTTGALAEDEPPKLWSYEMTSPEKIHFSAPTSSSTEERAFGGLLPADERWNRWRRRASNLLDGMVHLGPMRARIQPSYSEERPALLGLEGAEAPQGLRANPELADKVGDWFAENMDGWRLLVARSGESFSLKISKTRTLVSNLARAGEGLKQVLPVVFHQRWRQQGTHDSYLDVIEQPELHLHDAAQAPLADLFIATALRGQGRTVVETHSEPLLLRLQRRIAEGVIPHDRVALYFVDVDDAGSKLQSVPLHANGEVGWWPEGVFEEDFREVAALSRAQRRRSGPGNET